MTYDGPFPLFCEDCGQLATNNTRLYNALKDLLEKMEEIHENPQYKGVWAFFHAHGQDYTGPTYEKEFQTAKNTLLTLERREGSNAV